MDTAQLSATYTKKSYPDDLNVAKCYSLKLCLELAISAACKSWGMINNAGLLYSQPQMSIILPETSIHRLGNSIYLLFPNLLLLHFIFAKPDISFRAILNQFVMERTNLR